VSRGRPENHGAENETQKPLVTSTRSPGGVFGGGPKDHGTVPQVSGNSKQADTPEVSVTDRASSHFGDQHWGETDGSHWYDLYQG